jgi:hypothetical protein
MKQSFTLKLKAVRKDEKGGDRGRKDEKELKSEIG